MHGTENGTTPFTPTTWKTINEVCYFWTDPNHLTESEIADRLHSARDASMRDRYRALLWILRGEKRGEIANRIFSSLQELEDALVEAINEYCEDKEKVRQLSGYSWILEQLQTVDNEQLNC